MVSTRVVYSTSGKPWNSLPVLFSTTRSFSPEITFSSGPFLRTTDRILATAVTARWRYVGTDVDWDKAFADVRRIMLDRFALTHSLSLQQTLYAMGEGVLAEHPEIAEIRFSMPNKHHFLVDMSAWGIENPNEVWYAADRPYGLIEASVVRDDAPPPDDAWEGITGFA